MFPFGVSAGHPLEAWRQGPSADSVPLYDMGPRSGAEVVAPVHTFSTLRSALRRHLGFPTETYGPS
eukprot:8186091-Lingulodinium_polyedra.AAC.1